MRHHHRTWTGAALVAAAFGLAACGGGTDDAGGGTGGIPAPAAAGGGTNSGGAAPTSDLCAQFPPEAIQPYVSWAVPAGRSEVLGAIATCTYESAPGDAFGSVKIRLSPASSVPPPQNPYEVPGLGDSATVDRNFAATNVAVGDRVYTVQVVGAAPDAPDVAAAHPDLTKADGPASTEELQASLALSLGLADRFAA